MGEEKIRPDVKREGPTAALAKRAALLARHFSSTQARRNRHIQTNSAYSVHIRGKPAENERVYNGLVVGRAADGLCQTSKHPDRLQPTPCTSARQARWR